MKRSSHNHLQRSRGHNLKIGNRPLAQFIPDQPTEVTLECEPAAVSLRPRRKPLSILAEKVVQAGYTSNVRAIASGKSSTKLPRQLAIEIVHEIDGWHEPGSCCLSCTHDVQLASSRALELIFREAVPA